MGDLRDVVGKVGLKTLGLCLWSSQLNSKSETQTQDVFVEKGATCKGLQGTQIQSIKPPPIGIYFPIEEEQM